MKSSMPNPYSCWTAYSSMEFVDQAKTAGVVGYVVKPIKEESLIPMIEVGIARGEELAQKQLEIDQTKKRLEARALIEKAKGVLMKEHNIGEEEAFQMIRKLGMDKRRPMQDIAEIILLNHQ